jgi:hypothetical protein
LPAPPACQRADPRRRAASPSIPRKEIDAEQSRVNALDGARLSAEPPMSMPLAYPSTLDRRPDACTRTDLRPTWRGFGARVSARWHRIGRQKLALIC